MDRRFVTPGQQKQNKPASGQSNTNTGNPVANTNTNDTAQIVNQTDDTNATSAAGSDNKSVQNPNTEKVVSGFNAAPESTTQVLESNSVKVAGMSTLDANQANVAGTQEKIIKINLAWILLLFPLIVVGIIRKISSKKFSDLQSK